MDPLRQYEIAFVGLKVGVHNFTYQIDDRFFDLFSESLIEKADVMVHLKFEKSPSFFMLTFHLQGKVHLPCDRCGVELDYPVESENSVVVKFDEHHEGDKDDSMADIIYINRNETHFSVAQLIYEFILLSVPINHVTCDNLRGNKPCDKNVLNQLQHPHDDESFVDHRWDDLSKIKFN
jgi:uncharacterized metal-binding protein YceD (DUF177 family)